MGNYTKYLFLLFICVFSRLISAIYYIEDPDSLRFALCVYDEYNIAALQPHFPGYPVFCFLAKALYLIIGSFPISFAIIGGVSVYFIIYYLLRLLNLPLLSLEGVLVSIFIFFNPMIWLMSNRFMPDLAGVVVMIAAFYYLVPDSTKKEDLYKGWFLTGVLAGLKLSYIPFLVIPCFYALFDKRKYFLSIVILLLGVGVWLIPMLIDTGGLTALIEIAGRQTEGYLFDFGGTFLTEGNWGFRLVRLLQSIWADGLGGYWLDRNPALLLNSVGILACSIFGFFILLNFDYPRPKMLVLILSCLLYIIWVFLLKNIGHNSRHVLPLMPFFSLLIAYGIIYFLVNFNYLYIKVLMLVFLFSTIFLTIVLTVQHTYPTAIAQVREYLVNKNVSGEKLTIVSFPLVNKFLKDQNMDADFVSIHQDSIQFSEKEIDKVRQGKVIVVGELKNLIKEKPVNFIRFQHNPYVNKFWAEMNVYEYNFH